MTTTTSIQQEPSTRWLRMSCFFFFAGKYFSSVLLRRTSLIILGLFFFNEVLTLRLSRKQRALELIQKFYNQKSFIFAAVIIQSFKHKKSYSLWIVLPQINSIDSFVIVSSYQSIRLTELNIASSTLLRWRRFLFFFLNTRMDDRKIHDSATSI
jgi:hypothetical protein